MVKVSWGYRNLKVLCEGVVAIESLHHALDAVVGSKVILLPVLFPRSVVPEILAVLIPEFIRIQGVAMDQDGCKQRSQCARHVIMACMPEDVIIFSIDTPEA